MARPSLSARLHRTMALAPWLASCVSVAIYFKFRVRAMSAFQAGQFPLCFVYILSDKVIFPDPADLAYWGLKPSGTWKPWLNAGRSIKMTHQGGSLKYGVKLLSMDQCFDASAASVPGGRETAYRRIADWIEAFPNSPHGLLGRPGPVCPYTARAVRADMLRIGVCTLESGDYAQINELMRDCFRELKLLPCKRASASLQTIIVGFPGCQDAKGIATLKKVQRNLGLFSLVRAKMIAFFHPDAEEPGLWNPDFRPFKSTVPLFALRPMVVSDAPFVARCPQLLAPYLLKFPFAGLRRLKRSWPKGSMPEG